MHEFQTIANVETYHQDTSSPSLNPLDYCLPSGALSRNSIAFGWAPDDKINSPMSILNERVGGPRASTYGVYAQATPAHEFDDSQLTEQVRFQDILSSQAVLVAAIMPLVPLELFSSALCDQIATGLAKFRTNRFLPIRSRGLERAVMERSRVEHRQAWIATSMESLQIKECSCGCGLRTK
jgi:hypothetical protein